MNHRQKQRKPAWQRYLPVIYLVVLGTGSAVFFAWLRPVLSGPNATAVPQSVPTVGSLDLADERTSDEDYVRLAEKADAELRDKLRQKKESRTTGHGQNESVRRYEDSLAEKQEQFDRFSESADDERSIAYGLKKEIEAMKQDGPPVAE